MVAKTNGLSDASVDVTDAPKWQPGLKPPSGCSPQSCAPWRRPTPPRRYYPWLGVPARAPAGRLDFLPENVLDGGRVGGVLVVGHQAHDPPAVPGVEVVPGKWPCLPQRVRQERPVAVQYSIGTTRLFPFLGRRYNGKQKVRLWAQQGEQQVPRLAAGDKLTRAEYGWRWQAHREIKNAS